MAVKENLNNSEDAQRQFRREAVLLAHLRHPNLPQVIDYFLDESGRQYLVMEYVPGENMQEALASNGALPIAEGLTCMDQVMQAVAYMHRQRDPETGHLRAVIHRDIKPANIKRTPEGRYVLVDFGIAKVQSQTAAATAVSARALTPGYAPIEQYHGGTDERSDVYALGATLYALVTGKAPPSATNMASGAPLPPPRSYNSKIPANVSKVIERAMRLNMSERYPQVTEMYAALFNRPMPTAPGAANLAPAPRRAPRPDRTTTLVVGGIAAVTVAALWWLLANSSTVSMVAGPTPAPAPATRTATPAVLAAAIDPAAIALASATPTVAPTIARTPLRLAMPDAVIVAAPEAASATPSADLPTVMTVAAATAMPLIEAVITEIITLPESIPATTVTAEIKAGVSLAPRATSTPLPTATPAPTATPTPRPTATGAAIAATASTSASPGSANAGSGPTAVRITAPPDNAASAQPMQFAWEADRPLAPGQEFEIIFWRTNEDEAAGRGWVRSNTTNSVVIDPEKAPAADTYRWAVFLVGTEPTYPKYVRLSRLSDVRTFTASFGGSSADSSSGGGGSFGEGNERP